MLRDLSDIERSVGRQPLLEFFRVGSGKAEKEFCHAEVKRVELHDSEE